MRRRQPNHGAVPTVAGRADGGGGGGEFKARVQDEVQVGVQAPPSSRLSLTGWLRMLERAGLLLPAADTGASAAAPTSRCVPDKG